jgi:hypothetical protein
MPLSNFGSQTVPLEAPSLSKVPTRLVLIPSGRPPIPSIQPLARSFLSPINTSGYSVTLPPTLPYLMLCGGRGCR